MNKIYDKKFDETYYTDVLDNGLKVIIFHKKEFVVTSAYFGTAYGGLHINQIFNNKEYKFNPGIAHFLEHKLFESKQEDMLSVFTKYGANVNAFTSYHETCYYFDKNSKDIEECLNLLLDFVQDLDISIESVEKEKGIICEELSMYKQNPDSELINAAYRGMYVNYPLNNDIGGTFDSVNKITKDELEECYKINYHPSNMAVCICTPLDPEYVFNIIKNNQSKKVFIKASKPISNNLDEPDVVASKYCNLNMDVNNDKVAYAIKLKPNFKSSLDASFKERAMKIYLDAYFSKRNPDYNEWRKKGIVNNYFDYDIDFKKDYAYIVFAAEMDDPEKLKKLVDTELSKKDIFNEKVFKHIKNSSVGQDYRTFDLPDTLAMFYIRKYLEGVDLFDDISCFKNISFNDVRDIFNSFDYSNYSLIHISKAKK